MRAPPSKHRVFEALLPWYRQVDRVLSALHRQQRDSAAGISQRALEVGRAGDIMFGLNSCVQSFRPAIRCFVSP